MLILVEVARGWFGHDCIAIVIGATCINNRTGRVVPSHQVYFIWYATFRCDSITTVRHIFFFFFFVGVL